MLQAVLIPWPRPGQRELWPFRAARHAAWLFGAAALVPGSFGRRYHLT